MDNGKPKKISLEDAMKEKQKGKEKAESGIDKEDIGGRIRHRREQFQIYTSVVADFRGVKSTGAEEADIVQVDAKIERVNQETTCPKKLTFALLSEDESEPEEVKKTMIGIDNKNQPNYSTSSAICRPRSASAADFYKSEGVNVNVGRHHAEGSMECFESGVTIRPRSSTPTSKTSLSNYSPLSSSMRGITTTTGTTKDRTDSTSLADSGYRFSDSIGGRRTQSLEFLSEDLASVSLSHASLLSTPSPKPLHEVTLCRVSTDSGINKVVAGRKTIPDSLSTASKRDEETATTRMKKSRPPFIVPKRPIASSFSSYSTLPYNSEHHFGRNNDNKSCPVHSSNQNGSPTPRNKKTSGLKKSISIPVQLTVTSETASELPVKLRPVSSFCLVNGIGSSEDHSTTCPKYAEKISNHKRWNSSSAISSKSINNSNLVTRKCLHNNNNKCPVTQSTSILLSGATPITSNMSCTKTIPRSSSKQSPNWPSTASWSASTSFNDGTSSSVPKLRSGSSMMSASVTASTKSSEAKSKCRRWSISLPSSDEEDLSSKETIGAKCKNNYHGNLRRPSAPHNPSSSNILSASLEIWQIQKKLKRGEIVQGMLQLGPPRCTFGSGRGDSEPRICAPVMLGRTSGHMDWRSM